ncbi:hypothetical protein V1522DRAFT_335160, partial [Lipomyces starkeyi]
MSPKPSPQILRLVIMSLYCIFSHPAKSLHPAAGCLWAGPPPKCLRQSPNLRQIG